MARLLHCDMCGKQMDETDGVLRLNHNGWCIRLEVRKSSIEHGFVVADVCQSCKRNVMHGILDRPGVQL